MRGESRKGDMRGEQKGKRSGTWGETNQELKGVGADGGIEAGNSIFVQPLHCTLLKPHVPRPPCARARTLETKMQTRHGHTTVLQATQCITLELILTIMRSGWGGNSRRGASLRSCVMRSQSARSCKSFLGFFV
jgi:hypothetical protein